MRSDSLVRSSPASRSSDGPSAPAMTMRQERQLIDEVRHASTIDPDAADGGAAADREVTHGLGPGRIALR